MCEIIVCCKDLGNSGVLTIDSKAPKRGDVIAVVPDGWQWSPRELGNSAKDRRVSVFRLFKLPNVTVKQAANMLAPEPETNPQRPSPYRQFRLNYFDVAKIPAGALKTYWNDETRSQASITLNYTATQLATIVSQREEIPY